MSNNKYSTVTAQCPKCGKIKKLSFSLNELERYTWCINCRKAVIWKKIQ